MISISAHSFLRGELVIFRTFTNSGTRTRIIPRYIDWNVKCSCIYKLLSPKTMKLCDAVTRDHAKRNMISHEFDKQLNTCSGVLLFNNLQSPRHLLARWSLQVCNIRAIKRPCLNFANPVWFWNGFESAIINSKLQWISEKMPLVFDAARDRLC